MIIENDEGVVTQRRSVCSPFPFSLGLWLILLAFTTKKKKIPIFRLIKFDNRSLGVVTTTYYAALSTLFGGIYDFIMVRSIVGGDDGDDDDDEDNGIQMVVGYFVLKCILLSISRDTIWLFVLVESYTGVERLKLQARIQRGEIVSNPYANVGRKTINETI